MDASYEALKVEKAGSRPDWCSMSILLPPQTICYPKSITLRPTPLLDYLNVLLLSRVLLTFIGKADAGVAQVVRATVS